MGQFDVARPEAPWPTALPLVSVVLPSFNGGRFVGEAVASVVAQTWQDLEVLVVDSGSNEETVRSLRALRHPKLSVHYRPERRLPGDNRNYGIARARGKYICCLDADDVLRPTYLEKTLFLAEAGGYDVVSTAIESFGEATDIWDVEPFPTLEDLVRANSVPVCAVFRRDVWQAAGGFQDTDLGARYVAEDWRFWVRCAALGARIAVLGEPLILYRVHGTPGRLSNQSDAPPAERQREGVLELNRDVVTEEAFRRSQERCTARPAVADPAASLAARWPLDPGQPVILLGVPFLAIGGAERLLSRIVTHLSHRGFRVLVVTTEAGDPAAGDSAPWFAAATREIYQLPRFLEPDLWRGFVRYLIESRNVAAVWIAGSAFFYDALAEIKATWPRIKTVDLLFNTSGHTANNRKHRRHIDLNLVESGEMDAWLRRHGEAAERIRRIESGVDLECYRPAPKPPDLLARLGIPETAWIVGFCGRLSAEKAPETFLDVAARLADSGLWFLLAGGGPLADALRGRVERMGMGPRLQCLGLVEDTWRYLALLDVLVLPSRLDGRPMVVQESLASGVPVVASNVGALPELVQDGGTGFLCRPGDVEAFSQRILWLAANPGEHRRMKSAARAFAEACCDAKRMADRYEETFRGLLTG